MRKLKTIDQIEKEGVRVEATPWNPEHTWQMDETAYHFHGLKVKERTTLEKNLAECFVAFGSLKIENGKYVATR